MTFLNKKSIQKDGEVTHDSTVILSYTKNFMLLKNFTKVCFDFINKYFECK